MYSADGIGLAAAPSGSSKQLIVDCEPDNPAIHPGFDQPHNQAVPCDDA